MIRPLHIAHLSDLHIGDHSETIWTKLRDSLKERAPHVILITGDLVESPNVPNFRLAAEKIKDLCAYLSLKPADVYLVPGNHDYRIRGVFPASFLTRGCFDTYLADWIRPSGSGFLDRNKGLALFFFDSNFSSKLINAGGKIGRAALALFNRTCDEFEREPGYGAAAKIALLHHHPLPIPYSQQFEKLMVLADAGEFLRHLSQRGVGIVVHGHKHHRAASHVSLQDPFGELREIEVVACPSTSKQITEGEDRGYSLISLYENNRTEWVPLRYVPDKFVSPSDKLILPSSEIFISKLHSAAMDEKGYGIDQQFRSVTIDVDGDTFTATHISGLQVIHPDRFQAIPPGSHTAGSGQLKRPTINLPPAVGTHTLITPRESKIALTPDDAWRRGEKAYDFEATIWALNSAAIYQNEFYSKYDAPQEVGEDWGYEFNEISIIRPSANLVLSIDLPQSYHLKEPPRLRIYKSDPAQPHPWTKRSSEAWLERLYKDCLTYSEVPPRIVLAVANPPVGHTYRILWPLMEDPAITKPQKYNAEVLATKLFSLPGTPKGNDANQIMKDACDAIKSEFNIDEEIDVTLMARYVPPGKNVAKLKVIAANLPDGSPLWNQELDVGDSIPGIAFKRRLARSFVITAEDSGKPHGYMPATPDPGYTVVHSLPLLYENADGPAYGVITIASKAEFSALTFKANRDLAGRQKLYATVLNATVVQLHNLCAVPLTS